MSGATPGCAECAIVKGGLVPRGVAPFLSGAFVVHPRPEDAAVPGWFLIAPARHVEQWDELTADEQAEVGPLIGKVVAALRAETKAEKVYVSVFAEVLAHLHVHVIARTSDVPHEFRGPRIFLSAGADPAKADAIAKAVLARLSGAA